MRRPPADQRPGAHAPGGPEPALDDTLQRAGWLRDIVERSGVMVFHWRDESGWPVDLVTENVRQLGYTPADFHAGRLDYAAIMHPEDLQRVVERFAAWKAGTQREYHDEYRLVTRDGRVRWVQERTVIGQHADGTLRLEGVVMDITERKRAEFDAERKTRALAESEARFRILYDDNPSTCVTVDARGRVESVNRFGAGQLGYRAEALVGRSLMDLFHADDRDAAKRVLEAALAEPGAAQQCELRKLRRDGTVLWVREHARAVQTPRGRRVLIVCEDVTAARARSEELSWQAAHDPLTGLVNRREFERRLREALESATAHGREHALCYVDLDQFKAVNDGCGHVAGDELLRRISERLRQRVRQADTLARLGGDEFGVLMSDCTIVQAERVAGQLLDSIREFRFAWEDKRFRIAASIGLVPVDAGAGTAGDILARADEACYAAKAGGRNRIHMDQQPARDAPAFPAAPVAGTIGAGKRGRTQQMAIVEGKSAPAFTLPDADGNKVALKDFAGRHVIVYFYPRDDTPGCTKEACGFRDNWKALQKLGVVVLGVSPDDGESHRRFAAKYNLPFVLLSDPGHKVMEKYGAWGEKTMYGKKTTGVIRSSVWIGADGKVKKHWRRVGKAEAHPAQVLAALTAA